MNWSPTFPIANTAIPAVFGVAVAQLRESHQNRRKLATRNFMLQVSAVSRNMEFYIASLGGFL